MVTFICIDLFHLQRAQDVDTPEVKGLVLEQGTKNHESQTA